MVLIRRNVCFVCVISGLVRPEDITASATTETSLNLQRIKVPKKSYVLQQHYQWFSVINVVPRRSVEGKEVPRY